MKEEKFPNTKKPSYWRVCGDIWNLRGQHNWERGKTHTHTHTHTHTDYIPNHNSQWRSSPDAYVCHQRAGGCELHLRVRTRPECPEDNLKELT